MRVKKKNQLSGVLVLLVFAVFGVSVLLVLLTGADVVKTLSERDQESYDRRTTMQYITTRVRQADEAGCVAVESIDGVDVLILREEIEGEHYETRVYCYDGYVRELFAFAEDEFFAGDGEAVLKAENLSLRMEGQVITAELTDPTGQVQTLTLYLRSGEGRGQ